VQQLYLLSIEVKENTETTLEQEIATLD